MCHLSVSEKTCAGGSVAPCEPEHSVNQMPLSGNASLQLGLAARVAGVAVERGAVDPARGAALAAASVGYSVSGSSPGGVESMSSWCIGPVVVVAEDLRAQPGPPQRRAERLDQLRLLRDRHVHAGIAVRLAVLRLVLDRERVDRDARALVGLHELDEVARVGGVDPRRVDQPPADQRLVRLHPRRRAPGRADHLDLRVERERLAQQRQDLRAVVRDREAPHPVVGPAGRQVVVGVVRRPRRSPRRPSAGAGTTAGWCGEQAAHRGVARPPVEARRARAPRSR